MAECVKTERPVTVHAPRYLLTLTPEEASVLRAIFYRIGGSPTDSPRRYVEAMSRALIDAGVPRAEIRVTEDTRFWFLNDGE